MPSPLLGPIFASAGLGALVGLVRQWSEQTEHGGKTDFGGVRTHTFWAIPGCLGAVASRDFTPLTLPVVNHGRFRPLARRPCRHGDASSPGGASFAASLPALFVGALVAWNHTQTAVVVACTVMLARVVAVIFLPSPALALRIAPAGGLGPPLPRRRAGGVLPSLRPSVCSPHCCGEQSRPRRGAHRRRRESAKPSTAAPKSAAYADGSGMADVVNSSCVPLIANVPV